MTHRRPRQEILHTTVPSQLKQRIRWYLYVCNHLRAFSFFLFAEATGTNERSSKRAAVTDPKTSSNGISGRSSSPEEEEEEVSEMPVLTRVCSPATLPRLKRVRFRPVDGELCEFVSLTSLDIFNNTEYGQLHYTALVH